MFSKTNIFIVVLLFLGIFFRFVNLSWGSPFFFHPDERNIASSVMQLSFPNQFNPHFFAYGSVPIYLYFFTSLLLQKLFLIPFQFENVIMISRFYSAILSVGIIISLYFIARQLFGKVSALVTVALTTLSVGLIQFAHFGTVEMLQSFFLVWLFYFSIKLFEKVSFTTILLCGLLTGILVGTKISMLVILPYPILAMIFSWQAKKMKIMSVFLWSLFYLFFATSVFLLTNPFSIFDFTSFVSSLTYESDVARGTLPVFYTEGFLDTIPIVFQFTKVYPFLLNPFVTILLIPALFYGCLQAFLRKNTSYRILVLFFLALFLSQAFLFAKWTRYMIPTLPFIYLLIGIFMQSIYRNAKYAMLLKLVTGILFCICLLYSVAFVKTTYLSLDSRVEAAKWISQRTDTSQKILSEVYDLGILPFNEYFRFITLFNFYDYEADPTLQQQLPTLLANNKIIILPSQRIIRNRILNPSQFPKGYQFYWALSSGLLGYHLIYQTPCDLFCKLVFLGDPTYNVEETANVFDRPVVSIFAK